VGVISEAIFVGFAVRPALKILRRVKPVEPALSFKVFLAFYIPLVLTSLLNMLVQPIGSAALSRMPLALESLAIWPVVSSISFIFRSPGIAFNEVVVAQLERPGAVRHLRLFTTILGLSTTGLLLVLVTTPLAEVWLVNFAALSPELAAIAWPSLWLLLPLPALVAMQSWYQGNILNSRHTRSITEAIVLFLSTSALVLWGGVAWGKITGLYIGLSGFALATGLQTLWLWIRSRRAIQMTERGDAMEAVPSPVSR
nr:hypothetical protein [Anaerolineae bacterium]